MRKNEVMLGQTYIVKVSGTETKVRLDAASPFGGWVGTNLSTGRQVRIRTAAKLRRRAADVSVRNEGSLYLFTPRSEHARAWIDTHVGDDSTWYGTALVVEHPYARGLAREMQDAGLEVE